MYFFSIRTSKLTIKITTSTLIKANGFKYRKMQQYSRRVVGSDSDYVQACARKFRSQTEPRQLGLHRFRFNHDICETSQLYKRRLKRVSGFGCTDQNEQYSSEHKLFPRYRMFWISGTFRCTSGE